jgi:hypothetical protein
MHQRSSTWRSMAVYGTMRRTMRLEWDERARGIRLELAGVMSSSMLLTGGERAAEWFVPV